MFYTQINIVSVINKNVFSDKKFKLPNLTNFRILVDFNKYEFNIINNNKNTYNINRNCEVHT